MIARVLMIGKMKLIERDSYRRMRYEQRLNIGGKE